jgi:hypothetical protein
MRPTEKSFNQVKAILGKLDRNIDQLRAQKRTPSATTPTPGTVPASLTGLNGSTTLGTAPGVNAAGPTPNRPSSPFGRATPIPPVGN